MTERAKILDFKAPPAASADGLSDASFSGTKWWSGIKETVTSALGDKTLLQALAQGFYDPEAHRRQVIADANRILGGKYPDAVLQQAAKNVGL